MSPLVPILLCADDFGLSPGVSRAIASLLTDKRLSATSCMTKARFWPETAPLLKPLAGSAAIGLHVTLTALAPHPPLSVLLKQAFLRQLSQADIEAELNSQIDAFEAALGRKPDFLDGHQHVHVLPVIRDAVLGVMTSRLKGAWLRDVWEPLPSLFQNAPSPLKALALNGLGFVLHQKAKSLGIPVNRGFRGAYDLLGPHEPPERLFPRFLANAQHSMLIMCHPAHIDEALINGPDPVHAPREAERAYLASDLFSRHLAEAGVALAAGLG
ncbi:MAG: ChbG/HpnK family deacetylase [Alphaproteobacteria bacterium]|nr:ChbG/HpnK family deacetylase [Alphaproteobacteria bacterium]